ncbi:DUF2690 domain-containing protein [Actinoplanes sp. HUAS TT8]|uniref:DUF2690 domain-containing protein n=1 Tax=Actinoplanes sp. HUAS TT8 TaxID=3447453 RepID=UPI003F51D98A
MIKSMMARVLVALALGTGIVAAQPQVALAAGCSGYSCDGKDPIAMGCGSTKTAHSVFVLVNGNYAIGVIELRYSSVCRTTWARIQLYKEDWERGATNSPIGQIIRIGDNKHYRCSNVGWSNDLRTYTCYTPMVNDAGLTSYANAQVRYFNADQYAETAAY